MLLIAFIQRFSNNSTEILLVLSVILMINVPLAAVDVNGCKDNTKCNKTSQCSWEKLSSAVRSNHLDFIKNCLKQGAKVKNEAGGENPLLVTASIYNHLEIIKLLLDHGADINAAGENNMTALHFRVHIHLVDQATGASSEELERSYSVIRFLLDSGADIYHRNTGGQTAIDLAEDNEQILKLLKSYLD